MTGLYIHVPLCVSRCRYCDFYKETAISWSGDDLFLDSLEIELSRLPEEFAPETIFIGGGTPTALTPEAYATMLSVLRRQVDLSNVTEFTSEANPGTLTPEKLAVMKAGGINRVSIGVQSFNDTALKMLGRIHSSAEAIEGYRMLRDAGFDNINVDLIQSIPRMTPQDVLDDARRVAELGPEHISYYNLIYEPGTPMTRARDAGLIVPPGDDEEADNYFAVKQLLEEAGYAQYEISNFSRPGNQCLHNILYWQGGEYFGCGPSAHSHWKQKRFGNIRDLEEWCNRLQTGERPFDETEELSPQDKARETLVMWLRMTEGVDLAAFKALAGYDALTLCGDSINHFIKEGLLEQSESRLRLCSKALFVCNSVFSEIV